jgi:hypothetical protein
MSPGFFTAIYVTGAEAGIHFGEADRQQCEDKPAI